jgi:hypothetical protein
MSNIRSINLCRLCKNSLESITYCPHYFHVTERCIPLSEPLTWPSDFDDDATDGTRLCALPLVVDPPSWESTLFLARTPLSRLAEDDMESRPWVCEADLPAFKLLSGDNVPGGVAVPGAADTADAVPESRDERDLSGGGGTCEDADDERALEMA